MTQPRDYRVGEARPSQLMFTYGIGAIVDLPYLSTLVMGLDDWPTDAAFAARISETRLLAAVQHRLGNQVADLIAPPIAEDPLGPYDPFGRANLVGVPVATFPRWLLCPSCQTLAPLGGDVFQLDHNRARPEQTRYRHSNCNRTNRPPVVPARFLVACEHGHLDDFPWVEYVHNGKPCNAPLLRLIEYGPGGEARDLEVRCDECNAVRRMSEAFGERGQQTLPRCRGRRPHLRDFEEEGCGQPVRTLLLGASNLWFPVILNSLAIPSASNHLDDLVEQNWANLQRVESEQNVDLLRQVGRLGDFVEYADTELWQAIERYRSRDTTAAEDEPLDLRTPEWRAFIQPDSVPSTSEFHLRQVATPPEVADVIEQVVLVERLREVRALVGFTRIAAPDDLEDNPQTETERTAPLARRPPTWVPATDVRGEGVFIQFREAALQTWLQRPELQEFDGTFLDAHRRWRAVRGIEPVDDGYPGLRFVLLHSFSHALMRRLTLECGYAAASVRERLYARNPYEVPERPDPMAGVLIYTAAPDSEGTLGGLVALGEPDALGRLIRGALRDAQLCASDPLCAEHPPIEQGLTLHGAACHACMFAPETSCERGNRYLDRSVLVPTVENEELAFFRIE